MMFTKRLAAILAAAVQRVQRCRIVEPPSPPRRVLTLGCDAGATGHALIVGRIGGAGGFGP